MTRIWRHNILARGSSPWQIKVLIKIPDTRFKINNVHNVFDLTLIHCCRSKYKWLPVSYYNRWNTMVRQPTYCGGKGTYT